MATSWEKHRHQEEEKDGSQHSGLLVVIAGDSTMIQQFQLLSNFARRRSDFYPVVGPNAEKIQVRGDRIFPRCFPKERYDWMWEEWFYFLGNL